MRAAIDQALRLEYRDAAANRGGARAAHGNRDEQSFGRGAQFQPAQRARRDRLHQPGERTVLRDVQPDAAHGGRQVPSMSAERRRDGRAQGVAVGQRRRRDRGGEADTAEGGRIQADGTSFAGRALDARAVDVPDRWVGPGGRRDSKAFYPMRPLTHAISSPALNVASKVVRARSPWLSARGNGKFWCWPPKRFNDEAAPARSLSFTY